MKAIIPVLKAESARPLYLQLYDYLKESILNGEIAEGEKLPSLRGLADSLALSLTTVASAYEQLEVEGYVYSRPQSGYYVREVAPKAEGKGLNAVEGRAARAASDTLFPLTDEKPPYQYDLACFDFTKWKKCMSQVFTEHADLLMFDSDPQGEAALRSELCKYLYRSRGVISTPDQIVIGAGTQQITGYLSRLLQNCDIGHVVVEDPGYTPVRNTFRDYGFTVTPVAVDENGILLDKLPINIRSAAYINPNNQFPTGAVIPIGNRYRLLEWASANSSYIVEDDYNSELRYLGKPIPAMQGLDRDDRVVYLGSFSSTLFSSIKISYLVLPRPLAEISHAIKKEYTQPCSKAEQLTLAVFMERGYYQTNIKKLRTLYAQKLQTLIAALAEYGSDFITPVNTESGITITLQVNSSRSPESLRSDAAMLGLRVIPLQLKSAAADGRGSTLMLYYNQIPLGNIEPSVKALTSAWRR